MAQQTGAKKARGGEPRTEASRTESRVADPIGAADPMVTEGADLGVERETPNPSATSEPQGDGRKGSGFAGFVRETASSQLHSQKQRMTEGLDNVAHAVRQTTDQLRSQGQTTVADYVQQAANQIDKFAGGLRDKDLDEIVGDVQRFARRQPALFLGAAFTLGMLGARFFKSSSEGANRAWRRDDYGDQPSGRYQGRRDAARGDYGRDYGRDYGTGATSPGTYGTGSYGSAASGVGTQGSGAYGTGAYGTTGYGTGTDVGGSGAGETGGWTTPSTPSANTPDRRNAPASPDSPLGDVER